MGGIDALRAALPEAARDLKVNLQNVLEDSTLDVRQRWLVALSAALGSRNAALRRAFTDAARERAGEEVVQDAIAVASLMAMNNVYYRFRHLMDRDEYRSRPARLRMTRLAKPATNKVDFELACLAVSALNACQSCMLAHERAVLAGGLTEDHIRDAVRIASVVHAVAVALDAGLAANADLAVGAAE